MPQSCTGLDSSQQFYFALNGNSNLQNDIRTVTPPVCWIRVRVSVRVRVRAGVELEPGRVCDRG